jgi:hypothetical protein
MTKTTTSCDWVASTVTEQSLNEYVDMGVLPAKNVIHWRVPGTEVKPQPTEGEVIVFADHLLREFSPPGSKFFCDVLHFYQLHPQDISPNSVSNICNFQVFCEVYLQEEPSIDLFREYYYLNRQTEMTDGPSLELGGISIQRRRDKLGSIAKTLLRRLKILCRVSAPAGSAPDIHSPTGSAPQNGPNTR